MPDLEGELRGLAAAIEFPETPDIASTAHLRLREKPRRATPRRLIWAAAIAVLAVAAGLAVPKARTAVLHLFGVGDVQIQFVDRLPEVRPDAPLDLGTAIDPGDAPPDLVRPTLLGNPDRVYRRGDIVTLLYGNPDVVHVLLMEIPSSGFTPDVGKKLAGTGTQVEFPAIRGALGPGVWISGRPHTVQLPGGRPRLAGNTLIWVRDGLTLRLEGVLTLQQAVATAESIE